MATTIILEDDGEITVDGVSLGTYTLDLSGTHNLTGDSVHVSARRSRQEPRWPCEKPECEKGCKNPKEHDSQRRAGMMTLPTEQWLKLPLNKPQMHKDLKGTKKSRKTPKEA